MLNDQALSEITDALRNLKLITVVYTKEKTGETVTHKGGIYKIDNNTKGRPALWLWDVDRNDYIRQLLLDNIQSHEIHSEEDFIRTNPWPIELYGETIVA